MTDIRTDPAALAAHFSEQAAEMLEEERALRPRLRDLDKQISVLCTEASGLRQTIDASERKRLVLEREAIRLRGEIVQCSDKPKRSERASRAADPVARVAKMLKGLDQETLRALLAQASETSEAR